MAIELKKRYGKAVPRVDGVAKVTGAARYASDEPVAAPAYAYLVTSTIARGRILGFKLARARAVRGVLDILTYQNVGKDAKRAVALDGGPTTETLESDKVWHAGQIVAIVVANTYESAREAAYKVEVAYHSERASATIESAGATTEPAKPLGGPTFPTKGDAAAAYAAAAAKVDAYYTTPTQHHNAMELYTTTAVWDGPKLTVYDPSQYMIGTSTAVATQLSMDPANVRAVSRYVGGGFGGKVPHARTAWIAIAARRLGRPVKLVATRDDGFTINTYRAPTRQHVKLSATADGKLTSFFHEGWEATSRPAINNVAGVQTTVRMYSCPNIATAVNIVHLDVNTPGFMRAPGETPYMFGLESAIDELAYTLKMDPIELRRVNDTQNDPVSGLAFSSRSLMQCFDQAAAQFGWAKRNPRPNSMRDGDWLIGYGCASAAYPTLIGAAAARLSVTPDGKATVSMAGHELGTGQYTVAAITVADSLGLRVEDITVLLGDSSLPPVCLAGGSNNAASTAHVIAKACDELTQRVAVAATNAADSIFHGADPAALTLSDKQLVGAAGREPFGDALRRLGPRVEVYSENVPAALPPDVMAALRRGEAAAVNGGWTRGDVTAYAFGAHFVEIRVHNRTREIRVPRAVSAFAAGTIINPTTARSQYLSGVIWGLSSALFEATDMDEGSGRFVNRNLADYLLPVNADVPSIEIIMIPETDEKVNPLGIKGIGEVGIVGMNAAVANAVFHATGKRIRELPIRAEHLL